jgi:uncharacterized protein (TIGR02996 family)
MDAEERALIAAIVAHPDEDTPRLVYADWLQEHDKPERAELIRAQIGLARSKGDIASAAQRNEWNARVRALLPVHSKQWRDQLPMIPRVRWGAFERGMIESAHLTIRKWDAEFTAGLASLFGHTPLRVLRVHFGEWHGHTPAECAEMLRWEGLARFEELYLIAPFLWHGGADSAPPFFARLWAHRWGPRPRVLDLRECRITDEAVAPLLDRTDAELPALIVLLQSALNGMTSTDLMTRFGGRVRLVEPRRF